MFWRQATTSKIIVDAAGKALVFASAGSEFNDCCIAYRSDSDTVVVAEVVMIEGIESWGSTEITVSTADNVKSFTVDGTTYSFTDGEAITPSVTEFPTSTDIFKRSYTGQPGNDVFAVDSEGKLLVLTADGGSKLISFNGSIHITGTFGAGTAWDGWGHESIGAATEYTNETNFGFTYEGFDYKVEDGSINCIVNNYQS